MQIFQEIDTVGYYIHTLVGTYSRNTALFWKSGYRMRRFSYTELYDSAKRLSSLLISAGIKKGDRISVWLYNCPEWVIFHLGCAMSGIVIVPVDFSSRADLAGKIVRKSGSKAIFLSRFKDITEPVMKFYGEDLLEKLFTIEPVSVYDLPVIKPDDLLEIVYTSGTTGDPKGVMITNRNLVTNIRSLRRMMPYDPSYRLFSMLPLSHLFEQVLGLLYPLRFGASIVYARTRKSTEIITIIKKYKVNTILSVPLFFDTLREGILRKARERNGQWLLKWLMRLSAVLPPAAERVISYPVRSGIGKDLRFFICGGARLGESTEDFWNGLGIPILQGYGLTEASPVVSCNILDAHKPRSVGKSLHCQKIRIADDGEILIRGQNVTPGYYQNEEATSAAFVDGWFKTGDIGEIDSEGFLFIRGRKKEMILTTSGLNVFPQDIEMVLNEIPSVKESCVVAFGEEGRAKICAAIIPHVPGTETIEGIMKKANEKLGAHQRINAGVFWPYGEFPKTPTLKIKRREVLKTLGELEGREQPEEEKKEEAKGGRPALRDLVAGFLRVSPEKILEGSRLTDDFGLDSLGLVELVVMLEEWFGAEFDETSMSPDMTLAELRKLIESSAVRKGKFPETHWARKACVIYLRGRLQRICDVYLKARLKLSVKGRESLRAIELPVIFISNHVGFLDTFAIFLSMPADVRKRTAVAAAAEIYFGVDLEPGEKPGLARKTLPVLAPLFMNAFPFTRRASVRKSMGLMGELLDDGWAVLIYPEGERSLTGEMASFKPGIGMIASEMQAPIVPVKLKGSFDVLPSGGNFLHRDSAEVVFGKPLFFSSRKDYPSIAEELESTLRMM